MALWDSRAESEVRETLNEAKANYRSDLAQKYSLAVDYLEGRMLADVESILNDRFPSSQKGGSGQRISPVAVPLVQRYVAEAANLYNKPVRRWYVDANGQETDATREQTARLAKMLELGRYDSTMHRAEGIAVLLKSVCPWFQAKRGKLRVSVTLPYDVYALDGDDLFSDAADQDDYEGFIVELAGDTDDVKARRFCKTTPESVAFYEGPDVNQPSRSLGEFPNPFTWEQTLSVEDDGKVMTETREAPLQMLTWMHDQLPLDCLMPDSDVIIVEANRELNVMLSVLFDNIRFQGHAVPVKKVNNPADPKQQQRHGVRFPVVLDLNESFEYVSAATSYTDQVSALHDFLRLVTVLHRMNPNDFVSSSVAPASGFAKFIDSLPKLESRDERARRQQSYEEQIAAPRIGAIGIALGTLDPVVKQMTMRARFADVEFPRTEAERAQRIDVDLRNGLSSPARILAKEEGITVEEAQGRVDENVAAMPQPAQPQPQGGGILGQLALGERIRRQSSQG